MLAASASGDGTGFESFLEGEGLWESTPESFLADMRDSSLFRWLSTKKDAARYPGYNNSPQLTFLGNRCWEVVVRFEEGKLADVTLSLYNRGDTTEISDEKVYEALLEKISAGIEQWAGGKGVVQPTTRLANGMKLEKEAWVRNNKLALELRWSASKNIRVEDPQNPRMMNRIKFRGEYIQLVATKYDPNNDPCKPPATANAKPAKVASAQDLQANVKKDADGSVWIDNVPMVDQGQKGYCAAATTQRILQYYGTDIDEHVIAQIANTAATEGTRYDKMIDVLNKLSVKFRVRVKPLIEVDAQKVVALVTDYNNAARRQKKEMITVGRSIDVSDVYGQMDPDILKKVRCGKEKAGLRSFGSDIAEHVEEGIPLVWSVVLGIVPENPALPQASGGHMRIISGYNKGKNEIVYSDSWGQGHERKTMSVDDAWTITTGLYAFEPRR